MRFRWADSLVSPSLSRPAARSPRRACSQATTGLVNSCGRLKPDVNYRNVINSKWRRTMFCLQVCWLLLHSFKSILLFLTTNTSHSKEDLMSSRSCNLLVRDEGLLDLFVLDLVKDDFGVVQREQVPSGTTY